MKMAFYLFFFFFLRKIWFSLALYGVRRSEEGKATFTKPERHKKMFKASKPCVQGKLTWMSIFILKSTRSPHGLIAGQSEGHDLECFLEINLSETMFTSLKCKTAVRSINLIWAFFSVILRERFLVSSRRTWKKKTTNCFCCCIVICFNFFFYFYHGTLHATCITTPPTLCKILPHGVIIRKVKRPH